MKVYRDAKGRFTSKPTRNTVEDTVTITRDAKGRFAKKGSNLPKRDAKGRFIAAVVVQEAVPYKAVPWANKRRTIRSRIENMCEEALQLLKPAFKTKVVECSRKKCKTFRLIK